MRDRNRRAALATFLAALAFAAPAQESPPPAAGTPVLWECWNAPERDSSLACRRLQGGALEAPPIVRALASDLLLIPLYGPPVDPAYVERLARAVLCGRTPDCQVRVLPFSSPAPR